MINNMTLKDAYEGEKYIIQQINTDDEELNSFCFHSVVMPVRRLLSLPVEKAAVPFLLKTGAITLILNWQIRL